MNGEVEAKPDSWAAFVLVAAQFLICSLLVLSSRTIGSSLQIAAISILLILLGSLIAVSAWAAMGAKNLRIMPAPNRAKLVVRTGPYRWIRHPMYSGVLIAMLGLVIAEPKGWRVAALCVLFAVLFLKSTMEERLLCAKFDDYADYRTTAGRFLPRWFPGKY